MRCSIVHGIYNTLYSSVAISNEKGEGHCLRFRVCVRGRRAFTKYKINSERLADYSGPGNVVANHSVSGSPQIFKRLPMFSQDTNT